MADFKPNSAEKDGLSRQALNVLLVEDSPDDAELAQLELANAGYDVSARRVATDAEMQEALASSQWDVIIADYAIPGFGALPALDTLKQSGHDIPFIIVSGTVSDEIAVAAMRAGAHDYLRKDNLARLVPAIQREIQEARTRREKREAEAALRESETRFRSIYKNAAIGIKQVAMDGRLLTVNSALCKMLGYNEDELVGTTLEEITFAEDRTLEAALVDEMKRGVRDYFEIEKRYVRRDGSPVWVSVTSSLVRDSSGNPLYRVSVIQDLSERKRAEALEEQLQQAHKLEAIGTFAGSVAHDFNTVLNIILGYADLLLSDLPIGDSKRERVQQIVNSGQTGAALTRQLLAFSRRQTVSPRVVSLSEVVRDLAPMLQRLVGEDIELNVQCPDEPTPVKVDPGQMEQVVLNLAANARDAMPKGGNLTIEVKRVELDEAYVERHAGMEPGRYEMLAVSDTGTGMDSETLAHLFEPFFTTKSTGKGTGLGLATVYGIVKQNGGDIWVYSEVGVGSIFKIHLPRASEPVEIPHWTRHEVKDLKGNETILLVEDSKPLRDLTRELLTLGGYRVLEAANGTDALELSGSFRGRIHLLMTDIVMPKMRGPELATQFAQQRPGSAVMFLSGYTEEAMSHIPGASRIAILEKPYTADSLLRTVRQALDDMRIAA